MIKQKCMKYTKLCFGRFAGRTKNWCFKAFMSCDDEILDSLAMLGNNKRFVCILYRSKIHTKVNQLRWFLHSNRAAEGEDLLPTSSSLHLHIRWAHYIAMIWKNTGEISYASQHPMNLVGLLTQVQITTRRVVI